MTLVGIVLVLVSLGTVAIVMAMFVWAAREDGRDQARTDARIKRLRTRR